MPEDDPADVFGIPDLWKSSRWMRGLSDADSQFFYLDISGLEGPSSASKPSEAFEISTDGFFKLPQLLDSITGKKVPEDSESQAVPIIPAADAADDDIFNDAWLKAVEHPQHTTEYRTWDAFEETAALRQIPVFITEAGASAYDSAIHTQVDPLRLGNQAHSQVQASTYFVSLLGLSLGRSSVFFDWDEDKTSFVPALENMRVSGYSTKALRSLQDSCVFIGNATHGLAAFVQSTYKTHSSPGRVALAKAVDTLLRVLQEKLGVKGRQVRSALQLVALLEPTRDVLSYFKSLVSRASQLKTDERLLSLLFQEAQALDFGDVFLSQVIREVLAQVSKPWTDFAQQWIGVKVEEGNQLTKDGPGKSFVKVESVTTIDDNGIETQERDYFLDEERMPAFMPPETAQAMFEVGRNYRLLRTHHPDHPLSQPSVIEASKPPLLDWRFDWKAITMLETEVKHYEKAVLSQLHDNHKSTKAGGGDSAAKDPGLLQLFGKPEEQMLETLEAFIKQLDQPPMLPGLDDPLSRLLQDNLLEPAQSQEYSSTDFTPHWSLIPLLSFGPLVSAQGRLINREYIKLIFDAHHLRQHIALQRDFHLFGNGIYCSRLSHALFDADMNTAERQAGIALSGERMGLRLNSRENWPPASSELRLVLMGVLTESYVPLSAKGGSKRDQVALPRPSLPGALSFAIRDLSPEDIEKSLDPESLEALDFLRLSYKPPAPLAPIFTPSILIKYDKVFKHLLRVLRILYVVDTLFKDTGSRMSGWNDVDNTSLRFRFESHHFVSSISSYFFDSGVALPWQRFQAKLDRIEASLKADDVHPAQDVAISPDGLREYHDQTLDQIMHVLLLRKRQQPVLKLLEEIFNLVLEFSRLAKQRAAGESMEGNPTRSAIELYNKFKKKVNIFITVCRGLSEKEGTKKMRPDGMTDEQKEDSMAGVESTMERFLLKLEMSGYYS